MKGAVGVWSPVSQRIQDSGVVRTAQAVIIRMKGRLYLLSFGPSALAKFLAASSYAAARTFHTCGTGEGGRGMRSAARFGVPAVGS